MPNGKKATKKAAAKEKLVAQGAPILADRLETWGYRAHCETEEHFPCCTVLCPDIPTAQYWAGARHAEAEHAECRFKLERVLFDKTTYHILSVTGELPEVPTMGPIDWSDEEPYDLGPVWEQMSAEDMNAKGIPPAAIKAAEAAQHARPAISNEAPEDEEAEEEEEAVEVPKAQNGQAEAASPIGQSHPAPKSESTASHRPSGHRALKVSPAKPRKAIKAKPTKKGSLKMNGKNGKSKKRV